MSFLNDTLSFRSPLGFSGHVQLFFILNLTEELILHCFQFTTKTFSSTKPLLKKIFEVFEPLGGALLNCYYFRFQILDKVFSNCVLSTCIFQSLVKISSLLFEPNVWQTSKHNPQMALGSLILASAALQD